MSGEELDATMPRAAVRPPEGPIDLSIVLVSWNSRELIAECLRSLEASRTRVAFEVIISDNGSTDGTADWLRELEQRKAYVHCVFGETNVGFGAGNQRAIPFCQGRHILFLNTDTLVQEPLDALVAAADALGPRCGALGGRVLNADRTIQFTCRAEYSVPIIVAGFTWAFLGRQTRAVRAQEFQGWDHATPRDVAMVSGCAMLVPRHVLDEVGGWDTRIFLYYEDTDLCYRIRQAGYVVRYVPVATIIHLEGQGSRKTGLSARVLGFNVASARYFAFKHLGGTAAEQRLVRALRRWWRSLLLALSPAAALMPLRGPRATLRRRADLLRALLKQL